MKIINPIIELLAIKLYEHDSTTGIWPPKGNYTCWAKLCDSDKELYRLMASGQKDLYHI